MPKERKLKTEQLQVRVSLREKEMIKKAAEEAGQDVSSFVLDRVLPKLSREFRQIIKGLGEAGEACYLLSELNDFLASLTKENFQEAVAILPQNNLNPFLLNQVAAMVEYTAGLLEELPPSWGESIKPLHQPYFASDLLSLRMHLLVSSPPPFRKRNIFIDSTVGGRA